MTDSVEVLYDGVEVGGEGAGLPHAHLVAEDLVEEESVAQPAVCDGLPVLQLAELGVEHRDQDEKVDGRPGKVELREGLKYLGESDELLLDVLHHGEAGLEAELYWRRTRPCDGSRLAGVKVDTGQKDCHHHVCLAEFLLVLQRERPELFVLLHDQHSLLDQGVEDVSGVHPTRGE